MSWKNRIKGEAFEDIEPIEHRGKKVETIKNNNKYKVSKDYLRESTLSTQKPQKPQKPQKGEAHPHREVKTKRTEQAPAQNIPAPEPAGMGPEYERLWNQAWQLGDFIDDPAAAPIEQRRTRLPEMLMLRDRMADLRQVMMDIKPHPAKSQDPEEVWTKWEPAAGREAVTQDQCPARCKRTGKCYGKAWFTGKPGPHPGPECDKDGCSWLNTEKVSVING
jgi:hypothetical protein